MKRLCWLIIGFFLWSGQVGAVTVTNRRLFGTYTLSETPSDVSFSITALDHVLVTVDASFDITSVTDVPSAFGPKRINSQLTFSSISSGTVNDGESGGTTSAHINDEIDLLDDQGFINEGTDALLNLDYEDDASVIFAIPSNGITALLIAEDGGIDLLKIEHCQTSDCATPQTLLSGEASDVETLSGILSLSEFGTDESGDNIDQVWYLEFGETVTGYIRVTETVNGNSSSFSPDDGQELEIDMIAGTAAIGTGCYEMTEIAEDFEDISSTGTSALSGQDEAMTSTTLPFNFTFYGTSYSTVDWSTNGTIGFNGEIEDSFSNSDLEIESIPLVAAVLWDDWTFDAVDTDATYYETKGSSPNQRFILQWNETCHFDETCVTNFATFQAKLYETTNIIEFHLHDTSLDGTGADDGASATIGIAASNNVVYQFSFETQSAPSGTALRFTPTSCGSDWGWAHRP